MNDFPACRAAENYFGRIAKFRVDQTAENIFSMKVHVADLAPLSSLKRAKRGRNFWDLPFLNPPECHFGHYWLVHYRYYIITRKSKQKIKELGNPSFHFSTLLKNSEKVLGAPSRGNMLGALRKRHPWNPACNATAGGSPRPWYYIFI